MEQTSDAHWVEQTRAGDRAAFGRLVRTHRNAAYAVARNYVHRHDDAEDIVQDAFILAYCKLVQLREAQHFGRWLQSIVRTRALDWIRKHKASSIADDATESECAAVAQVSANRHADETRSADLWDMVRGLPAKHREAIQTYYLNGFSYQQTAEYLGLPVTTVKGRLQQARMKLKTALTSDGEIPDMGSDRVEKGIEEAIANIATEEIHETIPLNGTRHVVLFSSMDAEIEICQTDGEDVIVTGSKATVGLTEEDARAALDTIRIRGDQVESFLDSGPHPHKVARWKGQQEETQFAPEDSEWQIPDILEHGTSFGRQASVHRVLEHFPEIATRENEMAQIIMNALCEHSTRISLIHEDIEETSLPHEALTESVKRVFAPRMGPYEMTFTDDGDIESAKGSFRGPAGMVDLVVAVPSDVTVTVLHSVPARDRLFPAHGSKGLSISADSLSGTLNLVECRNVELSSIDGDVCLFSTELVSAKDIRGTLMLSDYDMGDRADQSTDRDRPRSTDVGNVDGEVHIDVARLDLTLGDIGRSMSVRNRFGDTVFHMTKRPPGSTYCLESDSGAITARLSPDLCAPEALGEEEVIACTLCGTIDSYSPYGFAGTMFGSEMYMVSWRQNHPEAAAREPALVVKSASGKIRIGEPAWLDREE
jgi:RNA polymerase sigma-70 factor, ECF subfamily